MRSTPLLFSMSMATVGLGCVDLFRVEELDDYLIPKSQVIVRTIIEHSRSNLEIQRVPNRFAEEPEIMVTNVPKRDPYTVLEGEELSRVLRYDRISRSLVVPLSRQGTAAYIKYNDMTELRINDVAIDDVPILHGSSLADIPTPHNTILIVVDRATGKVLDFFHARTGERSEITKKSQMGIPEYQLAAFESLSLKSMNSG